MTARHFDVVVLGRSLGCLVAAALLARRDLRVLLLGQGERAPNYGFGERKLGRRRVSVPFADSAIWRRVLRELALSQAFRRLTEPLAPSYCWLAPERRLTIHADAERLALEMSREFPEVKQLIDELSARSQSFAQWLGEPLSAAPVVPPESLFERLKARRWSKDVPGAGEDANGLLAKFPSDHAYRDFALLPAWFTSDWEGPPGSLPALGLAALSQALMHQPLRFRGGQERFEDFWLEHIRSYGGICELNERATQIVLRGRRVAAVTCAGSDETIGADNVICNLPASALAELSAGESLRWRNEKHWPAVRAGAGRYLLSCVVQSALLPEPLGQEAFIAAGREPHARPLHVQCLPCGGDNSGERLLLVEAIVSPSEQARVRELRAQVLAGLRQHLPFLDRHLLVVDSPHDGLPLDVYSDGKAQRVERIRLTGTSATPEPLERRWHAEPLGFLGLSAEPVRGPVRGSYLVGKTVLPALGEEGELIAAWSAAQLVTSHDVHRQRRRRQLWSKLDTE